MRYLDNDTLVEYFNNNCYGQGRCEIELPNYVTTNMDSHCFN